MSLIKTVWLVAGVYLLIPIALMWATPAITSISPTSGPPFAQVIVTGSGFGTSSGTVSFNGVAGTIVSWSATKVVVNAPDGSSGSGPVVVNWSSNSVTFSFIPTIKSISPQNVPAGQAVSVTGQNFGSSTGSVTLSGQAVQIVSWTNTSISIKVPANAPTGADPVVVTTAIGSSPSATLNVQFAPAVSGISPSFGPPNTQVTISGTGFGQNTAGTVSFNGVAGTITNWSDMKIVVTAPNGSAGAGPVVVSWQGLNSNSFVFNFLPTIFNLSPSNVGIGWTFSVVGQNFGSHAGSVTLNGTGLAPSSWTNNSINIPVITGDCTGPVVVTTEIGASNSSTLIVQGTNCGGTPLAVTASASPTPNSAGWNNTNVRVSFACTGGAAPVTCPAAQTVSTEGANQIVTGTATDSAGHTASVTKTLNIDKTGPVLSITSSSNGATFTTSSISISGSTSDILSGLASVTCNGIAGTVQSGSYTCPFTLIAGLNTISVQAIDLAGNSTSQSISATLIVPTTIDSFSPSSASIGSLVTIQGTGFTQTGFSPEVMLNQEGGGTIVAPISSATASTLSFVIPSGATGGLISIAVDGLNTNSSSSLSVVSSSSFSLTAGPSSLTLLPGQSAEVQVSLSSSNGFTQLTALSVSGLPSGVTASFQPPQITAGGFSMLTLSAPNTQTASTSQFTITAGATVQGILESQAASVSLNVQVPGGATFAGRVAVTDAYDTPLTGVTVKFTGTNYTGAQTGCTASTTTDSAGNFVLSGLPDGCAGSQMVAYDPSTVISPPGKYSGVTLSYVLTAGQVTTPGIVVHLPNVTNAETFTVQQGASTDQTFTSRSIPGVSFTVYAGTTFSLPDGSQPNPFPLSLVEIPYDKLPEKMPPDPTQDPVFAMSIEPDNSSSSQPIAFSYPNRSNTPPGITMPLTSLNPTMGMMVNYGTGTVSSNGMQIIPDADPANPERLYGVSHFDWFFFLPPPRNNSNPCPNGSKCPGGGDPVDLSSGILVTRKTDISFGGARGQVALTRIYRTLASNIGPFGRGSSHNYSYFLDLSSLLNGYSTINLITPDGNQFAFAQQTNGTFINSSVPSMSGAVITNPSNQTYNLRFKNGTVFTFQQLVVLYAPSTYGYLVAITDTNGNQIKFVRNGYAEITQIIDPVGRTLNFAYDEDVQGHIGIITSITDPIGRTVHYAYDVSFGRGTLSSVTDPAGGVTSYTYDGSNNLLSITDPRGITYLRNTYDQNGRIATQVTADQGVTAFSYTLLNPAAPTSPVDYTLVTDPMGNQTTYHFNPAGSLLDVTDVLGEKTLYNVDPNSNQTLSMTDTLGRTTAYTYDSAGNTTTVTRLAGTSGVATTAFTYDPLFNKINSITDPLGHATSFQYDADNGNLLNVTDAVNKTSTFTYDGFGEMVTAVDPLGNATSLAYSNGDLIHTTDPLGRTRNRIPDQVSRTISLSDPSGLTTLYQYDFLNQITQIQDAAGNRTQFNYDSNGNLLNIIDPKQQTTNYSYDAMDDLIARTDALGHTESYQYDLNRNLTQFIDRRGKATIYQYDGLNRKAAALFGPNESSVKYSYDAGGRLAQAADSIAGTISGTYDLLDRLTSASTPQGTINYSYDLSARRTAMQASGQSMTSYSYDNVNRLTQVVQGSSSVSLTYDADGRRTTVVLPNGATMKYSFDASSQLSAINYQFGTAQLGNLTYTYDPSGRRSSVGGTFARTGLPQAIASASYNANNQLNQFGSSNITYDANGNLTSDGVNTYKWDARNHLISIIGGVSANFQYDAFGRRSTKVIGGKTINYLYDGANPIEELSAGIPIANLLAGLSADEYFQRSDASGPAAFLTDALGTTIALANSSGNILAQYTYESSGKATITGSSTNPYQSTGRENDQTGLYFYRARYYSPSLNRFISEDPIQILGGINNYIYALNDTQDYRDPSGYVAGADDLVLAVGGALIGVGVQGASDLFTGQVSDWQHYAGAAAGGALGGLAIEYSGGVLTGAIAGTTTNAVTQSLEMISGNQCANFNYLSNLIDTGIGAAGGAIPDLRIPGISQGANSFNAIGKSVQTKLANGTISNVSGSTAAKALVGANVAGVGGLVLGVGGSALGGGDAASAALAGRKSPCQ